MEKSIWSSKARKRLAIALAAAMAITVIACSFPGSALAEDEPVSLIANHDVWKYDDTNTDRFGDAATDFRSKDYDDSAWESGASPLGYPASERSNLFGLISDGGTLMSKGVGGASSSSAYLTYYLRKDFNATDIAAITGLTAKVGIDDGFVMYLNGQEVARTNVPDGTVSHSTEAPGVWEAIEDRANVTLNLTAYKQYLVEGENTISVDIHNRDNTSSDIYWGMSLDATYETAAPPTDVNKTPKQVNVHMGDDPSDAVNVTYTTVASDDTKIVIEKADGQGQALTFNGEASVGSGEQGGKYVHKIAVNGLDADTEYEYLVGNEVLFEGAFKTAPAKGSDDPIRFIYLADTQVSNAANAKALGATLNEVASMDPDFVYLAGDITDNATSESQWEQMFYNSGSFPAGGETMFRNYLISAIQGNHDNNTFNRHINAPTLNSGGVENRVVYSYDYGPLTFIGLNLETARSNATARAEQETYLRAAVADAKARGQWTAVGFHKSLVTGASHITDSDVIEARTFWIPKFAELDVDMVLQGHDHVYSRGFVDATGRRADRTINGDGSINKPANAPLYMVGGHAGGLKWYSLKNYTVTQGDPIALGYSFLDVDSANPTHNSDGRGSDVKEEQVVVEMEVSEEDVEVNTYMFKYDTDKDEITTSKYLYDSMTMTRMTREISPSAAIAGQELALVDTNDEITYTVSYSNIVNSNAFNTVVEYDEDVLEFVSARSVGSSSDIAFSDVKDKDGKVRVITGLRNVIAQSAKQDVAEFTFKVKKPVTADGATVKLVKADTVKGTISGGKLTDSKDVAAVLQEGEATTAFYSYEKAADTNGDGKVTLADLSLALGKYQSDASEDRKYDIDLSGVVDSLDYVIISSFIA
ncbi:MAG: metallophosphoesterase [Clostridiales Family XIII bacterium]|jgi:hypothetical protein|nr:metallophosphoesterase [Clostridiales Family XIII bacterium]